jgi:cation transport regulator ChaC
MSAGNASASTAAIWYFAYGSNLDPRTFLGRRRMRPVETRVAILADFALVFDLPVGPGERGVANLAPSLGGSVCGVAYQISEEQGHHLDRSEGVPNAYQRHGVDLAGGDGMLFRGFTYVSEHRHPERKPSPRYMGLLLHGARHHGLPAEYIANLRDIELAIDERSEQLELIPRVRRSEGGGGASQS